MKPYVVPMVSAMVLLYGTSALAKRNCDLSMNPGSVSLAWNQNSQFQTVNFTITKRKQKPCVWAASFTRGGASDYPARRMVSGISSLRYQLYKNTTLTTILKDYPDVSSADEVLTGSFGDGNGISQTVSYYVNLPDPGVDNAPLKPSGIYSDTFMIKLYEVESPTSLNNADLEQATPIVISTIVPKSIELSITPSGGSFDPGSTSRAIDFGTLSAGQQAALDVQVRSNAGYQITMSSLNGGMMKHLSGAAGQSISYAMKVGGQSHNLGSGPVAVASGSGQTSSSGIRYPVQVTVGSTESRLAGKYSDSITVTVTTTD